MSAHNSWKRKKGSMSLLTVIFFIQNMYHIRVSLCEKCTQKNHLEQKLPEHPSYNLKHHDPLNIVFAFVWFDDQLNADISLPELPLNCST